MGGRRAKRGKQKEVEVEAPAPAPPEPPAAPDPLDGLAPPEKVEELNLFSNTSRHIALLVANQRKSRGRMLALAGGGVLLLGAIAVYVATRDEAPAAAAEAPVEAPEGDKGPSKAIRSKTKALAGG